MMLKLGAGLVLAAMGSLLALHRGPEPAPAAAREISFAPKSTTFAATCSAGNGGVSDSRPAPAWLSARYGDDNCAAPALPARIDGARASVAAIRAYTAAEKEYDEGAAAFRRCIERFVGARMAQDRQRGQRVDTNLALIENYRIVTSRALEKTLSGQVAQAVTAFNAYGSDCPD